MKSHPIGPEVGSLVREVSKGSLSHGRLVRGVLIRSNGLARLVIDMCSMQGKVLDYVSEQGKSLVQKHNRL